MRFPQLEEGPNPATSHRFPAYTEELGGISSSGLRSEQCKLIACELEKVHISVHYYNPYQFPLLQVKMPLSSKHSELRETEFLSVTDLEELYICKSSALALVASIDAESCVCHLLQVLIYVCGEHVRVLIEAPSDNA